jgi:16S rRNA (cytosine967-C5)-methyltransferase
MKYFSHLNTAATIIQQYSGQEPLHYFLRNFFARDKKYGSKDRRNISHLCYVFFRVGRMVLSEISHKELNTDTVKEVVLAGLFLCNQEPDELLQAVKPAWNENIASSLSQKLAILNNATGSPPFPLLDVKNLFPWSGELSKGIDENYFALSHLQQPDLFIRVRPGYRETVVQKLKQLASEYEFIPPFTIRLSNGYKVEKSFELDKEVVVQDLSSQRVGDLLQPVKPVFSPPVSVWDCCAASGGKSLMAKDILNDIDLTVSDIRKSILVNLKTRFAVAGLSNYKSVVADLSVGGTSRVAHKELSNAGYDLILADLPCTGSGTWSRTPEQLYFFKHSSIERYSQLQKQICINIIPYLKKSGKLLYVTCSVFKKENEDIVQFMQDRFSLKLEKEELLKGYDKRADTMYAALLSHL